MNNIVVNEGFDAIREKFPTRPVPESWENIDGEYEGGEVKKERGNLRSAIKLNDIRSGRFLHCNRPFNCARNQPTVIDLRAYIYLNEITDSERKTKERHYLNLQSEQKQLVN